MDQFLSFLKYSKQFLNSYRNSSTIKFEKIHIVLGNESCDLDSMCSSLILGYFYSIKNTDQNPIIILPIMNTTKDNFLLRTDNCYVAKEAGIGLDNLIFRNEICFQKLLEKFSINVTLVDHHILSKQDEILTNYIIEIYDHRPLDINSKWNSNKIKIQMEMVGSCCTLIANELFKNQATEILTNQQLSYLLYQPILFDTVALKEPPNGRATDLDLTMGKKLEEICLVDSNDRQMIFDNLWSVHNDVSHLTPYQLLFKDLKIIEGVYIPGLPMLVENYLKIPDAISDIEKFAEHHQINVVLLVGLEHNNGKTQRDIALYSKTSTDQLKECLLNVFNASDNEYDFQFEKRTQKLENIDLLHVNNIQLSRKALVVLVKIAWKNYLQKYLD